VCLPKSADNLPGAPRAYRKGTNPGFVFATNDACVPVFYRSGVIAAGGGEVIKAETSYKESTPAEFAALLKAVAGGANPAQMDKLRGREVWVRHPSGATTVYAHLSSVAPGIRVGARVAKGEWLGLVGNSGTTSGVQGTRENPRLLFELWEGQPDNSRFMGQGETGGAVKVRAKQVFGLK
jgi:murein DD-endopeptidase MepM/ murein hydrolase activator NlpD